MENLNYTYQPDLKDDETTFCKTYLRKKAFSGWERWREH